MTENKFENSESVEIVEVPTSDEGTLEAAALLITEYSWGKDYPITPLDELRKSEYCVGAYSGDKLVGFAAINRFASPDGIDSGELWLGYAVVIPEFRERGIYQKLYSHQMTYAEKESGRILSCTNNPIIAKFLLGKGWKEIRKTKDEGGEYCSVFEYMRHSA
ncbi:MAG: hypothetical protein G01um101419_139 [Parcubacteria group bacterium Gr01-1014_19]|nr:MAG: hypothetical protein G01um101419_139 [Parcubacteria group bacterium Gr01-1014_19]